MTLYTSGGPENIYKIKKRVLTSQPPCLYREHLSGGKVRSDWYLFLSPLRGL